MIKDFYVNRKEGAITIYTATPFDKEKYFYIQTKGEYANLLQEGYEKGIDLIDFFWKEIYKENNLLFMIVENKSGRNVGYCTIEGINNSEPTIGVSLIKEFWGKGYGYLAAKAMIEESWKILNHPYYVWEVNKDNIASKKIAIKLGGKFIGYKPNFSTEQLRMLKEHGLKPTTTETSNIERYKITRPK